MTPSDRRTAVLIMAEEGDLHALTTQRALRQFGDVDCHVVASDRLYGSGGLTWSSEAGNGVGPTLPTTEGVAVDVREIDVVWLRRMIGPQLFGDDPVRPAHQQLINSQFPSAVLGVMLTGFTGRWISDPEATRLAENKQVQLLTARRLGLHTPRTLVSTDPEAIRRFCGSIDGPVVIKSLRQSTTEVMMTQLLRPGHLESDDALRMCPAIYQEFVPGHEHIRVHVFGDYVGTMLIESAQLDWRQNLNVLCRSYELDPRLIDQLRSVLETLGLRMGIFDLKLNDDHPVWLELNPQGQFLFAEGLSRLPLMAAMAAFLRKEASAARTAPIRD